MIIPWATVRKDDVPVREPGAARVCIRRIIDPMANPVVARGDRRWKRPARPRCRPTRGTSDSWGRFSPLRVGSRPRRVVARRQRVVASTPNHGPAGGPGLGFPSTPLAWAGLQGAQNGGPGSTTMYAKRRPCGSPWLLQRRGDETRAASHRAWNLARLPLWVQDVAWRR